MNAPMTIDQLKNAIIAAKRQGWEEGRKAAAAAGGQLSHLGSVERSQAIVDYQYAIFTAPNPYGEDA